MHLVSERIPENLVHDGELPSPETMARFLKTLRSQEHIRERNCALVLSSTQGFFRHVTLPAMTVSELELNLPYEFRDFISDNPDDYIYDYGSTRWFGMKRAVSFAWSCLLQPCRRSLCRRIPSC